MRDKLYYYENTMIPGKTIVFEGEQFHHLFDVMRTRTGDQISLFNGNGFFYTGIVEEMAKKYAKIKITSEKPSENEPKIKIDLFQAMAKGDKISLIMQKITELGASNLVLFQSKFCDVKAENNKKDRMDQISISASKQCGRASIVQSEGVYSISEVCKKISNYDRFFVAYENEDGKTLFDYLEENKNINSVAILIGPEGGLATEEVKMLENSGAISVSLGKRILRTETAAISTISLISMMLKN